MFNAVYLIQVLWFIHRRQCVEEEAVQLKQLDTNVAAALPIDLCIHVCMEVRRMLSPRYHHHYN